MKCTKQYRYIGRNGILTTVVLLDGIEHIPMVFLEASKGHILTNGEQVAYAVTVEEAEKDQWREIVDNSQQ